MTRPPLRRRCACGAPMDGRSTRCANCAKRKFTEGSAVRNGGAVRTIDADRAFDSRWRPPHLPPACEACRGFGYVPTSSGDQPGSHPAQCPDCADHPGSVMSHAEWTAQR
jgi:hypothetical protein